MPRDNDPRRNVKPDDSAAYTTALTEIYGAKEELNALGAAAQQTKIKTTLGHLGTANELSNQQAAQDMAALGTSSANRQALYSQDISSAEAQGALREQYALEGESALRTAFDNSQSLYSQDISSAEAQGESRRLLSLEGDAALQTSRDNQLAGYDLELSNLGGRSGLLGSRHEKAQADLEDDSENRRQSAYNAALGSMYSGGTAAGLAQSADQSLADTARRAQGSIDRQSSLLDSEFAQAGSDLSTKIQKTELGRESTVEEYGHRLAMSGMQREMGVAQVDQQVARMGLQRSSSSEDFEHRLSMAEMQRDMDMDKVRQQVDRLRTQSGSERDENEYRMARAELSLQLQNSVSDNNIAIQEQALGLAQASEPLEATIFVNENVARLDRNSSNTFEGILVGGSN